MFEEIFSHFHDLADILAFIRLGTAIAKRIAIIVATTNSSTRVKPLFWLDTLIIELL